MWNPFTRSDEFPPPSGDDEDVRVMTSAQTIESPHAQAARLVSGIAEVERIGPVAVATLTITDLSQEDGAEQLAELLQDLSETGAVHFVLDVQNVQYMDTTCLGCLVEALNRLSSHGGRIALASPNHSVHYVFRLTRLDRVFRICPDVLSALNAVEK